MPYKDPLKRREYQRLADKRYALKHQLRVKAKKAVNHANRKAKELGVEGILLVGEIEKMLEACKKCPECSSSTILSIDHIVPFKKGGANTISNIQILCWHCNMKKRDKDTIRSWSTTVERCLSCLRADYRHEAHGLCRRCYEKLRRA